MTHDELTDQVLAGIEERLRLTQIPTATLLGQRILMDQNHYCGLVFEWKQATAYWFIEEEQVKIFDEAGQLLMRYNVSPQILHAAIRAENGKLAA